MGTLLTLLQYYLCHVYGSRYVALLLCNFHVIVTYNAVINSTSVTILIGTALINSYNYIITHGVCIIPEHSL